MYEELLAIYGLEDSIRQTNVTVLGCGMEVTDGEGVTLGEDRLLAEEGEYFYQSDVFERNKYQAIRVYQKEETLLTVLETVGRGKGKNFKLFIKAMKSDSLMKKRRQDRGNR